MECLPDFREYVFGRNALDGTVLNLPQSPTPHCQRRVVNHGNNALPQAIADFQPLLFRKLEKLLDGGFYL